MRSILFFISSSSGIIRCAGDNNDNNHDFATSLDPKSLSLKQEKLAHFRLYWHDIQSGRNPTFISVVRPSNASSTGFGIINVIDDPLTLGPQLSSKQVGRAQGFYTLLLQEELGLLMSMNFAFMEGKYNRSTITILGPNPITHKVREMLVIGGSRIFRFARGYVQARTHTVNMKTGDAIVQYDCYVLHY